MFLISTTYLELDGFFFGSLEFVIDGVGGSSIVASSSVVTFALVVTCERDREREHLGDDSGDE